MSTSYVDLLPSEILDEIFRLCLPTSIESSFPYPTLPPLSLGHISSKWRQSVHSNPLLWTALRLAGPPKVKYNDLILVESLSTTFTTQALYWLERSGMMGLSLSVHIPSYRWIQEAWMDRGKQPRPWQGFVNSIFIENAHRFQLLDVTCHGGTHLTPFLTHSGIAAPRLNSIRLDTIDPGTKQASQWTVLATAPLLRKFALLTNKYEKLFPLSPSQPSLLPWRQLTHLMIRGPLSSTQWYTALGLCTSLVNGNFGVTDDHPNPFSPLNKPMHLTTLTQFDITFYHTVSTNIFQNLYIPSIQNFALRWGDTKILPTELMWQHPSQDHLFSQLKNVRSLTLAYQNISSPTFLDFLQHTSHLVELFVDGDLGDYIHFLQHLTYQPGSIPLIPKLKVFDLYLEDTADLLFPTLFSGDAYIDMLGSRCNLTEVGGPCCSLQRSSLHIGSGKNTEALADSRQLRKDVKIRGLDKYMEISITGQENAVDWLPRPTPLWT